MPALQYVSLVLFCGSHLSGISDDNETAASVGGAGMIRTLVSQLLAQRPFDLDRILAQNQHPGAVDINIVRHGDIHHLVNFFGALIDQLAFPGGDGFGIG